MSRNEGESSVQDQAINVWVTDVEWLRRGLPENANVEIEPEETPHGTRRMVVTHPDGTLYELESELSKH